MTTSSDKCHSYFHLRRSYYPGTAAKIRKWIFLLSIFPSMTVPWKKSMMVLPVFLMREIPLDLDGKEYTNVRVKGRGNSSWKMPRRSYQIKLPNRDSVLGMPPAKKWLLIANYADASLMRNKLMYDLAHK